MHQGRQHLVIAVSGAAYSGELIAFRVPNAPTRPTDTRQDDEVTVTPLIHSSVQLEHAGKVIHVDPWSRIDLTRAKRADLILITDDVAHHLDAAAIARVRKPGAPVVIPKVGKAKVPDGVVLANGESGTFAGVTVEAVAAYDLTPGEPYHPKGEANGYVITLGAQRILIAGVTECVPELRAVKNIDIAFMPMNLPVQRMTPLAAAACTKAIAPKVVYVNHYDQDYASAAAKAGRVTETPGMARALQQFADALKGSGIELRHAQWYPPLP
jgi:L-ascorbate metabolism protein UlaG (beta-lactamase superfamily)